MFDPDGDMLATGTAADAQGVGLPALASEWGYLAETLGAGAIPCGHTAASIAAALDALTPERLATAAAAAVRRGAPTTSGSRSPPAPRTSSTASSSTSPDPVSFGVVCIRGT